jgi:hypothetical protein
VAAIVGSLDASQLAEEGKQLTAFRLFLLTRRRGQRQQQTEAGFPLVFLIGAGSVPDPDTNPSNKQKKLC